MIIHISSLALKSILLLLLIIQIKSIKPIIKCSNCKYYLPNKYINDIIFSKCLYNPTKLEKVYNLITDELIKDNSDYEYCTTARNYEYLCGKDAKFYTPKNK